MAAKLGELSCCTPEGEAVNKSYASIKSIAPKTDIGDHATIQKDGNYFDKGDTFNEAIEKVKKAKMGEEKAADLCLIYNTLVKAVTGRVWDGHNISSYITTLKQACKDNVVKKKTCKELIGDKEYNKRKEDCESLISNGEDFKWVKSKCECEEIEEGDVAPVEEIRGCMVNPEGLPEDVTLHVDTPYDPLATVNYGCRFVKVLDLVNKFCFCIKDTCHETGGGNCITGKQAIESGNSSYKSFEEKYNSIYQDAIAAIVNMSPPTTKISTEKGFYSPNGPTADEVKDLAKALTILHYRRYSLNRASEGNISKESDLVMYSPNGNYLGFFKGTALTSPRFGDIKLQLTLPIIHLRLSQNAGGYTQENHIDVLRKYLLNTENNRGSYRFKEVKNITIDSNGKITLQENITTVGLGTLLETKVIGLGKLLK